MLEYVPYLFVFVLVVALFGMISQFFARHRRTWQACAQKYRLSFKEGSEEKGERTINAYRLKGYYRTCMISIFSSPSMGQSETSVTVSYPKSLLDSLSTYPDGTLSRIGRSIVRQADKQSANRPLIISMPAPKGSKETEIQREINPVIKEPLAQLAIVCSGRSNRLDVTDAYLLYRQQGFVNNPESLFPYIDEMLRAINAIESNSGQFFK